MFFLTQKKKEFPQLEYFFTLKLDKIFIENNFLFRYPLGKEVVKNMHKLRASLSNLSRASDFFTAQYKVRVCNFSLGNYNFIILQDFL